MLVERLGNLIPDLDTIEALSYVDRLVAVGDADNVARQIIVRREVLLQELSDVPG